jgi:hypothetical protein
LSEKERVDGSFGSAEVARSDHPFSEKPEPVTKLGACLKKLK